VTPIGETIDEIRLENNTESETSAVKQNGRSASRADRTAIITELTVNPHWSLSNYFVFMTQSVYTVVLQVLRLYNGANDIEGIYGSRILRYRFRDEWREDFQQRKMVKTGRKNPPPPHDIDIVRGSAYGIFSRAFVQFILEDQRARDLLQWSRTTWSPDELYWATLHHTYSNPHLHTPGAFSG